MPASCVNNPSGFCAQPGVYGTLGIAAAGNIPGARDSAATWTDSNGNFWLFGGEGADSQEMCIRDRRKEEAAPFANRP